MSQSTARGDVIGNLMLKHSEGFLLVGDASKGAFDMRIELKGLNRGSRCAIGVPEKKLRWRNRYVRAVRHQ
jgi:hypothetical protein